MGRLTLPEKKENVSARKARRGRSLMVADPTHREEKSGMAEYCQGKLERADGLMKLATV